MKNFFLLFFLTVFVGELNTTAFIEAVFAANQFSNEILKSYLNMDNKNVAFSPISIWRTLNMIFYGASGNTKKEIESILNLKGINDITKAMQNVKEIISNGTHLAENIWVDDSFPILDSFKEKIEQVESGSFKDSPEKMLSIINQWVQKQTSNQIKEFFHDGDIDESTKLVLVSALSFKGLWKTPFKKENTHKKKFYLEHGTEQEGDFMYRSGKLNIIEEGNLFIEIPYENDNFTFIVTLPKEGLKINEFAKNQTAFAIQKLFKRLNKRDSTHLKTESDLYLPKFRIDHKVDLKGLLEEMGIRDLFTPMKADLSGISFDHRLYCSSAIHRAVVEVDEEGTKIEAATGSGYSLMSMPFGFVINRPFLFHIIHRKTGLILFTGVIKDLN